MCQSSATDSKLLTLPPYLHKNPSNYSHKLDKPYSCLLLFHKLHARLSFSFRRADALAMLTRKGHLLHDTRDIIKHLTKQPPSPSNLCQSFYDYNLFLKALFGGDYHDFLTLIFIQYQTCIPQSWVNDSEINKNRF